MLFDPVRKGNVECQSQNTNARRLEIRLVSTQRTVTPTIAHLDFCLPKTLEIRIGQASSFVMSLLPS